MKLCRFQLLDSTKGHATGAQAQVFSGIVENGTVLVQQSKIVAAGAKVKVPANATVIDTHGVIAPGFIDLHNHLTYNVFPRWHPTEEFGNRYDWQQKPIYQTLIEFPHASMVADGLECEMERYAEIKALSEGETSAVGSLTDGCSSGLAHNLDAEADWHVAYNVFPLQMTEGDLAPIRSARGPAICRCGRTSASPRTSANSTAAASTS